MYGIIFKARDEKTNKSYIGYSTVNKPPFKAARELLAKSPSENIQKVRKERGFDIEIIGRYEGVDLAMLRSFLSKKRSEFIRKYNTLEPNGFNVLSKGEISDRYRKMISGHNSHLHGLTGKHHPRSKEYGK